MSAKGERRDLWSPQDIAKLKLLIDQRLNRDEMAVELGRTQRAVEAKAHQLRRLEAKGAASRRQQRRKNGAQFFLS